MMSSQEQKMWFGDYDHYRAASDLKSETEDMQMAYLRLCLEPEIRAWAKIDNEKDHDKAIKALKKLCFEVINPAINRQIQVFRMSQAKSESASTMTVRLRTSYRQAEINQADWDRIECLLILKSITDDSILKELHKDIYRVMTSSDILEEVIMNLERSMKTLDF